MRISERGDVVTIDDTPGCLWLFGLWFVAGGVFAIAMLWIATNRDELAWWGKLIVAGIGLATVAAGVWVVRSHRATRTVFDRATGRCSHTVRTLFGGHVRQEFALMEVRRVEIVRSRDGDGDPMFQLRLWLTDSRHLDLHAQPVHGEERVLRDAARIEERLGLR